MKTIDIKVVEDQRREAVQLVQRSKELLEGAGELNDEQKEQIDSYLQQAEEIEKTVKRMERLREIEISQNEQAVAEEKAKAAAQVDELKRKEDQAGFPNVGVMMQAVYNARKKGRYDPRLAAMEAPKDKKDMSSTTGSSGGFLLPTQQRTDILTARAEASFLRKYANVIPMSGRYLEWTKLDLGDGAAGVSAFFGGILVYRTAEADSITETNAKFKLFSMEANALHGYVEIPKETIQDSPTSLEAFYRGQNGFGGAFAWREDYEALQGNGVDQMLGVINADCKVSVSRNTATTFKFVDAVTMLSRAILSGNEKLIWIINQSVMPQLMQMVDGASNNIWLPNAQAGMPDRLLGRPIHWTEKTPVLGTAGDVVLGDFSWFVLGDREGFELDVSDDFKFQSHMVAFKATERNYGAPWLDAAITLADGSTTVSPFVILS